MTTSSLPPLIGLATPTRGMPRVVDHGRHRNPRQPNRLIVTWRWAALRSRRFADAAMVLGVVPLLAFGLLVALWGGR